MSAPLSLKRSMKVIGNLMLTLSAITPASSVFVIAPGVVQQAGSGAFLAFALAGVVGVFIALVYAELASAYPLTGGEYAIVGRIMGAGWGAVVLGVNLVTFVLMFAALSLGVSAYLSPIFPNVSQIGVGVATVVLTTLFGILNIRLNAVITGVFLLIELSVLFLLSWLGFAHAAHPVVELALHPVILDASGALASTSWSAIGLATAVAIWGYNGYGQAVYFGEETHDARRNLVRVIFLSLAIAIVAEAVPVTALLMGSADLKALFSSSTMLTDFVTRYGGEKLNMAVSSGVALAIFNALIAMVLMCSRVFYSSGRDNVWAAPISRALAQVHSRFHSPWVATFVFGALGLMACFVDQKLLFVIIGTSVVVIYIVMCLAVIMGRMNGTTQHAAYRMPLFPLPPILGLLALGYIIYANYLDEAVGRPSLWATAAMIVVSLLYYAGVLRRRGGWKLYAAVSKVE